MNTDRSQNYWLETLETPESAVGFKQHSAIFPKASDPLT